METQNWPPAPLRWPEHPLSDGTISLDRMTIGDVPAVVAAIDDEILRWLPLPSPYREADAVTFLGWQASEAQQGTHLNFAVRTEGDFAGCAGLSFRGGPGVAEVGYWVGAGMRGRGIAARATRLLAAYAFTTFQPRRVELLIQPENVVSCRAAEMAGAVAEGIRRAGIEQRGGVHDALVYSLLPGDVS